jgi:hypothetical protein
VNTAHVERFLMLVALRRQHRDPSAVEEYIDACSRAELGALVKGAAAYAEALETIIDRQTCRKEGEFHRLFRQRLTTSNS